MASDARLGRRKNRRPKVIAAGVVYMLIMSTIAVVLSISLIVQIGVNHTAQEKELKLLQEHGQLLHTYERAANGIDTAAGVIAYNEGVLCGAFHLSCKPLSQPLPHP